LHFSLEKEQFSFNSLAVQEAYKLYSPMKNEHRSDGTVNIEWIKKRKKAAFCEGGGAEQGPLFEMTWFEVIHETCSL